MKVYLRKSVLPSIKKEILYEMLQTAQLGMDYYKDLFGIGY
jgi:hypothetical protein